MLLYYTYVDYIKFYMVDNICKFKIQRNLTYVLLQSAIFFLLTFFGLVSDIWILSCLLPSFRRLIRVLSLSQRLPGGTDD